jgi:DNA-binding NtrC family response regulator
VLFVDDEEELVSAVVERLELRGVEAIGLTSGAEALLVMETQEFDVVVLDVKMPGLSGLDVMRWITQNRPAQKVVLLSGHGSVEDAEEGMRLGAFNYLMKPVDTDELLEILNRAAAD